MKTLRKIHLYLGLILGAALLLTALSGTILVFREELIALSMQNDELEYKSLSASQSAAALKALIDEDVSFIDFPRTTAPWFRVWTLDGNITYHQPLTFDAIPVNYQMSDMMMFLADLHIHFLSGELGEVISGYLGIFATFMIFSGLYIWWPMRSGFTIKKIIPKNLKRGEQLKSHRSLGMLASTMLVLIVVTGVALVFYAQSQKLIGLFTGEEVAPIEITSVSKANNQDIRDFDTFVRFFHANVPDGIIARYYPPREGNIHRIRYKYPEDWATYGASFLIADFDKGHVTGLQDYRTATKITRIARKYYPLHAGKWGNDDGFLIGAYIYKFLLAMMGTALVMLIFTGYMSWFKKRR